MSSRTSVFDNLEQLGMGTSFISTIADMLESADMFRDLARQEVEIIAQYVNAYSAPKGSTILYEGSKEAYMFIITEGRVGIYKNGTDYKSEKKLATVRAGKTIGEMSLIDGMPHSATAVVTEPSKLLVFTHNNFENLTNDHPELALILIKKIATLMSLRLRQTSGVLVDYLQS